MRVVGAEVRHPELPDQELRELEDLRGELFDAGGEALVVREVGGHGVELADHAHAGARGRYYGVVVLEDLDEAPDERYRLALVAGVEVHLAAAGLLERKFHPYPRAASRSSTVARPVSGKSVSLKQVIKRATRTDDPFSLPDAGGAPLAPGLDPCPLLLSPLTS